MPCLARITCAAGGAASTSSLRPNQQFLSSRPSPLSNDSSNRGQHLYTQALQLARQQDYQAARSAFQECCREAPDNTKVRLLPGTLKGTNLAMMLSTNHQGVSDATHPDMVSLTQAWGLMELQKGNILAAVLLLERSVQFDPRNSPVLKWRAVQLAQQTVLSRRRKLSDVASQPSSQLFL